MIKKITIALFVLFCISVGDSYSQKSGKFVSPKKRERQLKKKEKKKAREIRKAKKKSAKRHLKIQDKKVRRRIKRNKRRSNRKKRKK